MQGREDSMAELKALLARRQPLYGAAQLTVDTSAAPIDQIVAEVLPIARDVVATESAR